MKWGTGGINIDGCRVGTEEMENHGGGVNADGRKYGNGKGIPALEKGISVATGRFPANFIHDGSDEVVGLFPDSKGEKRTNIVAVKGRGDNGMFGDYGETLHDTPSYPDSGSASRFFYCAKASKKDRNEGLEGFEEKETKRYGDFEGTPDHAPKKDVTNTNFHPTVKPTALMQYLVRLVTPI